MADRKYTVQYRRKEKTNYKKRLKLLTSRKVRVVIRSSNNGMKIQFVNFDTKGDIVITGANSHDLTKLGYKASAGNTPGAYLTGLLAGKKAIDKKIKESILDLGKQREGERLYAALKGVVDAGVNVPHSDDIFPKESRLKGEHIKNFQHSSFESTKKKILGK